MNSKLLFIIMLVMSLSVLDAQQSTTSTSHEIYLSCSALQPGNVGLQYKAGLNDKTYFRVAVVDINSAYESNKPATTNSFPNAYFNLSGGLEIGLEKRTTITERMKVFYGIDLICRSGLSRYRTDGPNLREDLRTLSDFNISPGLGFNSGIILNIKNGFYFAAALTPRLLYHYKRHERIVNTEISADNTSGYDFDLDSGSVRISFVYQWNR